LAAAYTGFGILIFAATLAVIIIRPYRIPEALSAAAGGLLMLAGGYVRIPEAWQVLRAQWNVYGFFLGLMVISAVVDQAGLFDAVAYEVGRRGKGSARRLYALVFAAGALLVAFLSNDATALILTPVVYSLVTRLRLPVLPFMFACTFIADTASFLLPVSNPINILVLDAYGSGLGTFFRYLLLPSLFCIALNVGLFLFLFRRDLRLRYRVEDLPPLALPNRSFFRFCLAGLAVIGAAYVLGSIFQAPLSIVALAGGLGLAVGALYFRCLDVRRLARDISWPLFIFISGMFLVIRGIENLGVTAFLGQALADLAGNNLLRAVLLTAGGSALGANLINNVPMALVMISALQKMGAGAAGHSAIVYATILGADLGPNLTIVGSLATMLWLLILRRRGVEISSLDYFKLGVVLVPVMVGVGALLIWLGV
jgi:arsenical pump membrane protein